ncbi:hypothetical protein COCNU_05G003420 [Cocos nucifera]|uniref:Uncharacterized protein n=1 Tax=Cocos nucifera TaxID=13894 RepID=A0A8K0I837_COCNU|nr:hypothetical protein COCNU_05G003420 [Cocos nucifera]
MQTLPATEEEIGFMVAREELVLENGEDLVVQLVHIEARFHPGAGAGVGAGGMGRGRGVPFSSLSMASAAPPLTSACHRHAFSYSISDVSASMVQMEAIGSPEVPDRAAMGAGIDVVADGEQSGHS